MWQYIQPMMSTVCLRAVLILLYLSLPHLGCGIGSLDARDSVLVDPYAFDYDHNSQTNKNSGEMESNCAKQIEDACKRCSEETQRNCGNESQDHANPQVPQPPEKDKKICDSVLFRHLIKRISKAFTDGRTEQVVITLDNYRRGKLQTFLSDETGDVVPGVDIVHMLADSLSPLSGTAYVPYNSSWFERTFSLSFNKALVGLLILASFAIIFKLLLTGHLSFTRVICALVVAVLIINFFWSYVLLHQKKISERMANDAQRKEYEEVCHPQKDWTVFQKVKMIFSSNQKDERCQKFIESYQIDPSLEVTPIEAILYTFELIITSLSGAFGKGLGNFNQDFFSSVSLVYWIPAMLFSLLLIIVILAVYLYCGKRQTIAYHVRDNQAPQQYLRDNERVEEARRPRIETRGVPALQPPPSRQQGKVSQSDQSGDMIENSGASSSVAGGRPYREDGSEIRIRRRKVEDVRSQERFVAGEGDCMEKDSQRTTRVDRILEQRLEERVQDVGTVQSERKLGRANSQSEDGKNKMQPKKSNVSGIPVSNTCCSCEEVKKAEICQKEDSESDRKEDISVNAGEGEQYDEDFVVIKESLIQ